MSQFLNSCHLASVFAGSSSCLPEASVVFVEQRAQDGSRGTSMGTHMNTSQLSLQQEKGWEGIGRDMELSGQIQPRLGFTPFTCTAHFWFLLSPGKLVLSCPIAAPCSGAARPAHPELWCCTRRQSRWQVPHCLNPWFLQKCKFR